MERRVARAAVATGVVVALAVGATALGVAVSGSAASAVTTQAPGCGSSDAKLTVQGSGMATGTPDLLTVSVGIDVTDATAQGSMADDNGKAAAVTTALTKNGVLDKDVQTTNVSIQPRFDLAGNVTGYEMTNTLTAKLRDFSSAGAVVDALGQAAGNAARIDSLSFSVEDPRPIEDQARTDAVRQAVSHARSMADAAGERLGPVCSLTDDASLGYNNNDQTAGGARSASPADHAVPLEPGTQQATAQVTLVYALAAHPR